MRLKAAYTHTHIHNSVALQRRGNSNQKHHRTQYGGNDADMLMLIHTTQTHRKKLSTRLRLRVFTHISTYISIFIFSNFCIISFRLSAQQRYARSCTHSLQRKYPPLRLPTVLDCVPHRRAQENRETVNVGQISLNNKNKIPKIKRMPVRTKQKHFSMLDDALR